MFDSLGDALRLYGQLAAKALPKRKPPRPEIPISTIGRALKQASFRDRLRAFRYPEEQRVIVGCYRDDQMSKVVERLYNTQEDHPRQCVLAVVDPAAPHGLWLLGITTENFGE